jgi:hypothetical protein
MALVLVLRERSRLADALLSWRWWAMNSTIIKCDDVLRQFAGNYALRGNAAVELEYLRRAQVRAFYGADGTMIAGFALNKMAPFRYVSLIPNNARAAITEI